MTRIRTRTRTGRRCLRLTLSTVVTAVVVVGCGVADVDGRRPDASRSGGTACAGRVALMMATSGPAAHHVEPAVRGARLAHQRFRAEHPECEVDLVTFDTEADPAKALAAANKIAADERFLGVVGGAFSGETRQTLATFEAGGVTMISPSATATDLTKDSKVFHRLVGNDGAQGAAIGRYLVDVLRASKVFVVDDGSAYGQPLASTVIETLGGLDRIGGRDVVQPGQTDFSATVSKVASSGADAVFYAGYAAEAGPLTRQLRAAGVELPFVGGDGLYGSDFPKAGGRATEGAIVICPCQPPGKVGGRFATAYRDAYGELPGSFAAESYDAAMVLFEALKALRRDATRARVERFVDSYDAPGVSRHIRWDVHGDIDRATVRIWAYTVERGRPVPDREIPLG